MQPYTIDIRPRRQVTFPRPLLEAIGIDVGDKLVAEVKEKKIILKPQKVLALNAFFELQRLIKESGVTEKEMQKSAERTRKEIYAKRYKKSIS